MTILLFPLGRGNLKDTMFAQRISFIALIILLGQFYREFFDKGVVSQLYHMATSTNFPVPWWGSNCSKLGGVILFNYAYAVTVPSWLNEKKDSVNINRTIWGAVGFSSFLYITFGKYMYIYV